MKKGMDKLRDKNDGKQQENMEAEKQLTAHADTENGKKRKRKEVAIFGNYRNYYGYRIGKNVMTEDPRLKVMRNEWFEGKDCLDIGCNSGIITISIARKFRCKSILGIDIDGDRVKDAGWILRKIMHKGATKIQRNKLSDVVSFQKGNFIEDWKPCDVTSYHVILCLSVTKWIHLNWGDDGIIKLFSKVWKLLEPGGVFILEPQPWISYFKNRQVSESACRNYEDIVIGPEHFQEILLDKIGFRTAENLSSNLSGCKTGFDRPILAFWK